MTTAALCFVGPFGCRQALMIDEDRSVLAEDAAPLDAASDVGVVPSYCANLHPAAQFCADFDDGPVLKGWDNTRVAPDPFVSGGGTLERDDVNFRSASHGVSIGVPDLLAPSMASVSLVKSFSKAPANFFIDFEVRIDTEDFGGTDKRIVLFALVFPHGQIEVWRGADGLTLATYDEKVERKAPSIERLAVGAWRRLGLVIVHGEITLQVDGVHSAALPFPSTFGGTGTTYLGVGVMVAAGTMHAFRASFDNVSFTSDGQLTE